MANTPNHSYNVPAKGTANWHKPLNENFKRFEVDIELRDTSGNRGNYRPTTGAKFLATDTGIVYRGDGSNWNPILALARYRPPGSGGQTGTVIAGHPNNTVTSGVSAATIAGGGPSNANPPNEITRQAGAIGGGEGNTVNGLGGVIAGGLSNTVTQNGGTVGGGSSNESGNGATVGGGDGNMATAIGGTIAGGARNEAGGVGFSSVGGGFPRNEAGGVGFSSVGGGFRNDALAEAATIPGGQENTVDGDFGFAAGRKATAKGAGSFAWGDSSSTRVTAAANSVVFQAGGGATIYTSSDLSTGVSVLSGSGSWSSLSARTAKSNVEPVDPEAALDGVRDLDVATWNYDGQDDSVRHMGPMAEDFFDEFGLGDDRERIANVDADGVAFAAIQAMADSLDAKTERIDALETENDSLRDRVSTLEDRLDAIEDAAGGED